MQQIPHVQLGIVAVSRDCFPIDLSAQRVEALVQALCARGVQAQAMPTIVESYADAQRALAELQQANCNALVLFLGNFGPEGPETWLAQHFAGPVCVLAAAEERIEVLKSARGDAYCGLLNCSYNLGLRGVNAFIPERPVGTAEQLATVIASEFWPIARAYLAVKGLKIITFGPRPQDFFACNGPIAPLFRLGVEVEENSELDLRLAFEAHADDERIPQVVAEMEAELGEGNRMPGILPRLAQYELTLLDWAQAHVAPSERVAFANKCWPAFQPAFGFVPCYVNARLTQRGIPVSCEVDIYGALSEMIGTALTGSSVTLLDINNTVPKEMFDASIAPRTSYTEADVFMGFHCGNTCMERLKKGEMKYQLIMNRGLENGGEPDITRGTLEGAIVPGDMTLFRLQGDADGALRSYVAEGEVLDVDPQSFGGIGVIGIAQMHRFYRHVLVEKHFPHHACVLFEHAGRNLFSLLRLLGIDEIDFNRPAGQLYATENPFA